MTRRKLLLAGIATLTANSLGAPLVFAHSHNRLIHPHTPLSPGGGREYTVMLDPGHGGIDSCAVGHEAALEKHVVLDIANNIKTILKGHGNDALLTRSNDNFIPLNDRVHIAHVHRADLFMSIHADGFTSPSAYGASVYALSTRGASTALANYLSHSDNAADIIAGNRAIHKERYLDRVIFDLEQTETIKESLVLGSHIIHPISTVHHMHSNQTEQAAFGGVEISLHSFRAARNLVHHQPCRGETIRDYCLSLQNCVSYINGKCQLL